MHSALDKRVFVKEAQSLAKADFDVCHIAFSEAASDVRHEGVRLILCEAPTGRFGRLRRLPTLYRLARQVDADCYHCNELDSWLIGVLLRLMHRKRCVVDIHEHYPSDFVESRNFPKLIAKPISLAVSLGYRILTPLTEFVVLAKQTVDIDFQHCKEKLVVVANYAQRSVGEKRDAELVPVRKQLCLVHLGLISRVRGWPQMLDALALVDGALLTIIGEFNDGSERDFQQRVTELGLNDRVVTIDWMPFEQAYERLLNQDVGLVTFQPGIRNHVYAMPHKVFDYMLAGLAVVVPSCAVEVAPIVLEADCGFAVDTASPIDIAKALVALKDDPELLIKMGGRGRQAVIDRYNWETESQKLVRAYQELAVKYSDS